MEHETGNNECGCSSCEHNRAYAMGYEDGLKAKEKVKTIVKLNSPNPRKTLRKHMRFLGEQMQLLQSKRMLLAKEKARLTVIENSGTFEDVQKEADNWDKSKWSIFNFTGR